MLTKVEIDGVNLPRLYMASTPSDVQMARENGLPFVCWSGDQDSLIKCLLRPTLEEMFPYIDWDQMFGPRNYETTIVEVPGSESTNPGKSREDSGHADIADSTRLFDNGALPETKTMSLQEYVEDTASMVNLDVLQSLKLMPQFIGDILDCVKVNLVAPTRWQEGYNKKLGMLSGNFNRANQLPNLIILDVSASIPRGISATMISLIDTLRTQVSADLIITGGRSYFYEAGTALPQPQEIRDKVPLGNESEMFITIINDLNGKHYGHVFSFGDNDSPCITVRELPANFKAEVVHHYHTWANKTQTGYASWISRISKPNEEFNTNWCKIIRE